MLQLEYDETFGIVGGYGPFAGARFQSMLVKAAVDFGAVEDTDFPRYVYTSLPQPVISRAGEVADKEAAFDALVANIDLMPYADQVYVLCNTFHTMEAELNERFNGRIVSLPSAVNFITGLHGAKKTLVVCSAVTAAADLYGTDDNEVEYFVPDELIQAGMEGESSHAELNGVVAAARAFGADSIVLGCTDLSVFEPQLALLTALPVFDSLAIAVAHLVNESGLTTK